MTLGQKSSFTVFENHRKSLIQHCERSELRLHFEWTKVHYKCKKGQFWRVFENLNSVTRQVNFDKTKWVDNAKSEKFNATFCVIFNQCVEFLGQKWT